jgi:hypothetical protein
MKLSTGSDKKNDDKPYGGRVVPQLLTTCANAFVNSANETGERKTHCSISATTICVQNCSSLTGLIKKLINTHK